MVQQKLDAVWAVLDQFPAYKHLRAEGRKSRGCINTDTWNRQVAMIQDWRDAALEEELSGAEFKQKLDGV